MRIVYYFSNTKKLNGIFCANPILEKICGTDFALFAI
jgi:hypothetical protein